MTGINLWKSARDVLTWYRNCHTNQKSSFINFDIIDFYPSITESLLLKAINHAKQYTEILDNEIDIIIHAKRTLVFNGGEPWKKKGNDSGFDVTMGSLDGAETCELVVCYILSLLQQIHGKSIGLYRDDGLGISTLSAKQTEKGKQNICKVFSDNGLRITMEVNKKVVNFLDVTLDLKTGQYKLYMKPNNKLQYINVHSNHPPSTLKSIPQSINKRLSEISSCKEAFYKAAPTYQQALDESGFDFKLHYEDSQHETIKRPRKRNIIWFNPPYDLSVKTNIGKEFLRIITKCFPPSNKLYKIFNRSTVKLSYSCMPNMKAMIDGNNKKLLEIEKSDSRTCNCPKNATCPLDGECLASDIVYQATVTCDNKEETYVGITATSFKARFANHKASFKSKQKRNSTELSKHIWELKDNKLNYAIKWKILCHAPHYSNKTKKCNLCLSEKYYILYKQNTASLNKKSELLSKCRHKDKFLLKSLT